MTEMGATKSWVCEAFGISRQTLHNYEETKRIFGLEGLANSYRGKGGVKSLTEQRGTNSDALPKGNPNVKLREMRSAQKVKSSEFWVPNKMATDSEPLLSESP